MAWQSAMAAVLLGVGALMGVAGAQSVQVHEPEFVGARLYQIAPGWTTLFLRNAEVAIGLVAGFVAAGAPTMFRLVALGFELTTTVLGIERTGVPPIALAAGLVPHGLLEVPAFCMSGAAGLGGTVGLVQVMRSQFERACITAIASVGLAAAAFVLLAAAALVEVWLTPALVLRAL